MTFQNIRSMLTIEMKGILTSGCTLKVLRHGNRFGARGRRRYFSEEEKRRPEIRLLFVGYAIVCSRFSHSGEHAKVKGTRKGRRGVFPFSQSLLTRLSRSLEQARRAGALTVPILPRAVIFFRTLTM